MKLTDLDHKNYATEALKQNFDVSFNPASLDKNQTRAMLAKVTGLIKESKETPDFYKNQTSSSYMKLTFMEQALRSHYNELQSRPSTRIVVENEEVEKSQVILAAQDMVDSIQKMLEEVSDMQVKELPALVNGIQSEIGINESGQFNSQVSEALNGLNTALQDAKTALQNSLNEITGVGGSTEDAFSDQESDELDLDAADQDLDMADQDLAAADQDLELPDLGDETEVPEEPIAGGVGRAKR